MTALSDAERTTVGPPRDRTTLIRANQAALDVSQGTSWSRPAWLPSRGFIAAVVAIVAFFLMRDTPKAYGLPPVEEYKNDYPPHYGTGGERTFTYREIFVEHVLTNKYLWAIAIANASRSSVSIAASMAAVASVSVIRCSCRTA